MQSRAVNHFARCGAVRGVLAPRPIAPAAAAQSQRFNSFIKNVMDQVKKDMEKDPKLKDDWQKWQKTSENLDTRRARNAERMGDVTDRLKSASSKTSEILSAWKDRTASAQKMATQRYQDATEKNESLRKAQEFIRDNSETVGSASSTVFQKTKGVFSGVMDKAGGAVGWVGGESDKNQKLKQWREAQAQRDVAMKGQQEKQDAADAAAKMASDAAEAAEAAEDPQKAAEMKAKAAEAAAEAEAKAAATQTGDAMVVSKTQDGSSWDRFGAGLRDMPFLSSVFENPLFDRMFGESEIAASIREMKDNDPSFFLEDFAEEIEEIVAPHIVQNYLDGNSAQLELQCGEAAFAAVNASIKARKDSKMTLDTNILSPPREVELKGAQRQDKGPPCFIWTFNTQQVNCLKDKDGEIIEGAVDDIRTVYYAMAVVKHPELEKTLEYPWMVSELAIVGNQPSF